MSSIEEQAGPSDSVQEEILARLRRVEGQIRGIQRMIVEGRDCEAVATQLLAARAALDKASVFIMSHHIEQCLVGTSGRTDHDQLDRVVSFFMRFASGPATAIESEEE
mgnify:FL=1|jgi:DNA-binding FrmR family transcriptional regulator